MAVQTDYYYAPDIGFPGQITETGNAFKTFKAVAAEELGVGIGVMKGDDLTDPQGQIGFKVALPTGAADPIGITVRIASLENDIPNSQAGVPVYTAGELVTYLVKGAILVEAAEDIVAGRSPVYVENDTGGSFPLGTLITTADGGKAALLPGAYFEKQTVAGKMVKVVIV